MSYEQLDAELYDRVYSHVREDIEFWQRLAREYAGASGHVLELACGTLRVTLPVAEAGVRVTGIDRSSAMLALARRRLEQAPPEVRTRVTLYEADIRSYDLGQSFNLIYIPFNTFGLLLEPDDQLTALATAKRNLAPGGVFAFDVFVPDIERLSNAATNRWQLDVDTTFPDGVRVQRDNTRVVDTRRQITSVTWRIREYREQLLVRELVTDIQLAYFWPRELEHLLARAGYEIVHYWGNYTRENFWTMNEPWKQIIVARPQ
jgi:SAM-dependent methyltransferase